MNEQRPAGTSPGSHPTQPPRLAPVAPHAAHAPQPSRVHPISHAHPAAGHGHAHGPAPVMPVARHAPNTSSLPMDDGDDDLVVLDDALTLEDDAEATPPPTPVASHAPAHPAHAEVPAPKKITFSAEAMIKQRSFKRKPHLGGQGACRVKTFHGKCSDQGMEYLDDAINAFLDEHPDIEVKHVTSNVAMFDGKFKDFALIVNVWY